MSGMVENDNDNCDEMGRCAVCGRPVGDNPYMDQSCNFACEDCGRAALSETEGERE